MQNKINGFHHLTAVTSNAEKMYRFVTDILGLRLLAKTVNQDDVEAYHLYFGDQVGTVGTLLTFFDFPQAQKSRKEAIGIATIAFAIPNDAALRYWIERLNTYKVTHSDVQEYFGKASITFEDFDGQTYQLISQENQPQRAKHVPWSHADVPKAFAISGLAAPVIFVENMENAHWLLTEILAFQVSEAQGSFHLFAQEESAVQLIVAQRPDLSVANEGFGRVHHLAFSVPNAAALRFWQQVFAQKHVPHSELIDRYYFQSVYFTSMRGILFELATQQTRFAEIAAEETAGEQLILPPHLEEKRTLLSTLLAPLHTSDANEQRKNKSH